MMIQCMPIKLLDNDNTETVYNKNAYETNNKIKQFEYFSTHIDIQTSIKFTIIIGVLIIMLDDISLRMYKYWEKFQNNDIKQININRKSLKVAVLFVINIILLLYLWNFFFNEYLYLKSFEQVNAIQANISTFDDYAYKYSISWRHYKIFIGFFILFILYLCFLDIIPNSMINMLFKK